MKSLFWALILLTLIMYGYAVIFVQAYVGSVDPAVTESEELRRFYSTIPRAIFGLFMCISGGISWVELIDPLAILHWSYVLLFISFIGFVVFAVLNVVTGVFCQNAIESASKDEEEVVAEMVKQKINFVSKMEQIFSDLEHKNGFGCITLTDFENKLQDDRAKAWFKMLDLEVNDAWTLFKLLDVDGGGLIDIEEFV